MVGQGLSEQDIPRIRALLRQGIPLREIGETFGVSHETIRQVRDGITWRHVPDDADGEEARGAEEAGSEQQAAPVASAGSGAGRAVPADVLTLRQAAALCGYKQADYLRQMVAAGRLETVDLGTRDHLTTRRALRRFLLGLRLSGRHLACPKESIPELGLVRCRVCHVRWARAGAGICQRCHAEGRRPRGERTA